MSNKNISGFIKYIKNIEGDMIMNLLIFFAIVLSTIILAIVLQRIIHCPILVGFAFFSIYLIVAAVLSSQIFVIIAIIVGIIAFLAAFLDCIFSRSRFWRDNSCLNCDDDDCRRRRRRNCNCNDDDNDCECNCHHHCHHNCGCDCNNDDELTIVNSNGNVVARINGNSISCNSDNTGCVTNLLSNGVFSNNDTNSSNCGCNNRINRCRGMR